MLKNKLTLSIAAGWMALVGMIGGTALMASAASTATNTPAVVTASNTVATSVADTPESANDVADTTTGGADMHGHAPLGGDGVVASITGTNIVIGEESDEGSASYTVDASKATVTNNGVTGTISDIKVGTKIFVQGTTTGTNVSATSISVGGHGGHMDKPDGTEASGANDPADAAGSSDASGQ
jgi:hypothetical protein